VALLPYLGGICRLFGHLAAFFPSFDFCRLSIILNNFINFSYFWPKFPIKSEKFQGKRVRIFKKFSPLRLSAPRANNYEMIEYKE
jgi:hypothetical protein